MTIENIELPKIELPKLDEVSDTQRTHKAVFWVRLRDVKTIDELNALLAEVLKDNEGNTIHVQVELPPEQYIRMMSLAWVAYKLGEIDELTMKAYMNRAYQLEEYNLNALSLKKWSA